MGAPRVPGLPTRPLHLVWPIVAVVVASCTPSPSAAAAPRVVVLYDGSVPDAREIVSPSVLAADLGLRQGGLEPWLVDTGGDPGPAAAAARAAAADPRVVGVIVAPFVSAGPEAGRILVEAEVPTLTLSQVDGVPAGAGTYRRMTPGVTDSADVLADAAGPGACLLAARDPWSEGIAEVLAKAPTAATWRQPRTAGGCAAVVWSGPAAGALSLRPEVDGLLVVTDQSRTPGLARSVGPDPDPTVAVCGCVDPASDASQALQAFAHDYQEETGLDPGPYAAEAFDAASLLASLARGGTDRAAVAEALTATRLYDGAAGRYEWDDQGVLTSLRTRRYQATGVRWLPV